MAPPVMPVSVPVREAARAPESEMSATPILIATIMRREGETGLQTHIRAFLKGLQRNGRRCAIVTPYDAPRWQVFPTFAMRKLIHPLHTASSVWWHGRWHEYFLQQALRERLRDRRPCIIYAQCPPSARAALRVRSSPLQRVVMVVHFNISQADEWVGKGLIAAGGRVFNWLRACEDDVFSTVDGIVYVSHFMRTTLLARNPVLEKMPHVVVPNFIADPGQPPLKPEMRGDLINIGTLEPRKNQGYLLDILAVARDLGSTLNLTLVGDGPDSRSLEKQVRRLRLQNQVRFTGFVENGAALLAGHHAYVHAARMENLPLTLIEALSRGMPVFAPAVGGIPEIFVDGVHGRMLPLDDAPRAAASIIAWLRSPPLMAQAGLAARRHFLAHFESNAAVDRLSGFFCSLAH